MVRYLYPSDKENPYISTEIEYYKTHACPKGELLFEKASRIQSRQKPQVLTLSKFLLKTIKRSDLLILISSIATAIKIVSVFLRGNCQTELETMGCKNYPQWKKSKYCQTVITNVFINQVKKSGAACIISCKHFKKPLKVEGAHGKYSVVISPIDGPRGMNTTGCMGSVFGIYPLIGGKSKVEQILRKGTNLICSGYALYGSSTVLYIALRVKGTHGFILQIPNGEFIMFDPQVKMPASGPLYSLNEGRSVLFEDWFLDWLYYMKNPLEGDRLVALSRNTNSKVADIHQILKWGGIYIHPDIDDPHYLAFELIPLSFVLEEARGLATNRKNLILDIEPKELHETSEVYFGSKINVSLMLIELNPSLLIKCNLFTITPNAFRGGKMRYKGLSRNDKEKLQLRGKKNDKRRVTLKTAL